MLLASETGTLSLYLQLPSQLVLPHVMANARNVLEAQIHNVLHVQELAIFNPVHHQQLVLRHVQSVTASVQVETSVLLRNTVILRVQLARQKLTKIYAIHADQLNFHFYLSEQSVEQDFVCLMLQIQTYQICTSLLLSIKTQCWDNIICNRSFLVEQTIQHPELFFHRFCSKLDK